jgi:hypothetical protein
MVYNKFKKPETFFELWAMASRLNERANVLCQKDSKRSCPLRPEILTDFVKAACAQNVINGRGRLESLLSAISEDKFTNEDLRTLSSEIYRKTERAMRS